MSHNNNRNYARNGRRSSNNNHNNHSNNNNNNSHRTRYTSTSSIVGTTVEIPPSLVKICKESDNFVKQLNNYRLEGKQCDFTIVVGGESLLVHKVVLSMGSKYFEAMFNNNGLLENEKKMVTYEDVEAPFVRLMLDFIYLNEIELNDDNIQEIANLSSRFQIMDLAEQCADFMHRRLRVDNCIGVMRFADLLAFTNLRLAAKRFVESNFAEIIKEEEFLDLPFYMLKSFIKSEDLSIDSEDQVLEATLRWIAHEAAVPRLKHLDEFLDLIRMPLINVSVLTKFMAHYVEHPKIVDALQRFVLINQQKLANGCHGSDECLSGYEMVRNQPRMAARRSIFMIGGASVNRYSRHPSQISNVVEKFDLHSYEWIEMASMKIPRYSHSAVVLDRKIYVIGGNADSLILDSVEVYCPKRDEWRLGAQLKKPRTNLGACVFDGRIYVFGGLSCRPHRSIEVLDPDQGPQWHYYDNLPMRMYSMKAIEHKRYIYIIGGCDENKQALDTVFRYNPIKKEFTAMARMNQPRFLFGCVAIHNLIYVFGGLDENNERLSSAEQYNIKEDSWTFIPEMPHDVISPCAVACNNMIYVFGGCFEVRENHWQDNKIVSVYEPDQNLWNFGKQLKNPRSDAASVLL